MAFFTTNIDPQAAGVVRRRVTSMFGDVQPEGNYHEPQKIVEDTLLDVCFASIQVYRSSIHDCLSTFRMNTMKH